MTTKLQSQAQLRHQVAALNSLAAKHPLLMADINARPEAWREWTEIEPQAAYTLETLREFVQSRNAINSLLNWECREVEWVLELRVSIVEPPKRRRGAPADPNSLRGRLRGLAPGMSTRFEGLDVQPQQVRWALSQVRKDNPRLVVTSAPDEDGIEVTNVPEDQPLPAVGNKARTLYPFDQLQPGQQFKVENFTPAALGSVRVRASEKNRTHAFSRRFSVEIHGKDLIVKCFTVENANGTPPKPGAMRVSAIEPQATTPPAAP